MSNVLTQHAFKNVWCEPAQQSQFILAPARLTPFGGALKTHKVVWSVVGLPNYTATGDSSKFHVYQIGQVDPEIFSIEDNVPGDGWLSTDTIMQSNKMTIDVYLDNGCVLPRTLCYLKRTSDKNFILAVKIVNGLDLGKYLYVHPVTGVAGDTPVTLDEAKLYIRFYNNDRFDTTRFISQTPVSNEPIRVLATVITTALELANFKTQCTALKDMHNGTGNGLYTIDGYIYDALPIWNDDLINKQLCYTYDASVSKLVDYPLAQIPTFTSTLDVDTQKYLLVKNTDLTTIEYAGDLDFYLGIIQPDGSFRGVWINQAISNVIRMVTHNAYSVRVDVIQAYITQHTFLSDIQKLLIKTVVRDNGYYRGLTMQRSRIEELYKLPVDSIKLAMSGSEALVPEWSAATLENSAYCALMRSNVSNITDSLVADAYGYNVAISTVCNPDSSVTNNQFIINECMRIPETGKSNPRQSVFGYDSNGKLIGWINSGNSTPVYDLPPSLYGSVAVEQFPLKVTSEFDGVYYNQNVASNNLRQYGFRCYVSTTLNGVPTGQWDDVTGSNYYTLSTVGVPTITWNIAALTANSLYGAVRVGGYIHMTTVSYGNDYPGYIRFTLLNKVSFVNTVGQSPPGNTMTRDEDGNLLVVTQRTIAPGVVDVFMNGESLIQGIDYFMNYPEIVIVKRPIVDDPTGIVINVRCYGLCNPVTMKPYIPREVGFIRGGVLSRNGYYNPRNDSAVRVVVGGKKLSSNSPLYAETGLGSLTIDGRPYAVTDYIIPSEIVSKVDTVDGKMFDLDMDNRVGDYLTGRLPEPTYTLPVIQNDKWATYSPFLSAVIHAFGDGFLDNGQLDNPYTVTQAAGWLGPYMALLPYDPCVRASVDLNYVIVYPHQYTYTISVTQQQFSFLDFIVRTYLGDNVRLTPSVNIG